MKFPNSMKKANELQEAIEEDLGRLNLAYGRIQGDLAELKRIGGNQDLIDRLETAKKSIEAHLKALKVIENDLAVKAKNAQTRYDKAPVGGKGILDISQNELDDLNEAYNKRHTRIGNFIEQMQEEVFEEVAQALPNLNVVIPGANLNKYPPKEYCVEFGKFDNQAAAAMGDMHACAPKLIYFALVNGMARFNPEKNKEQKYERFVELCAKFANLENLSKDAKKLKAEDFKNKYGDDLKELEALINQIDFSDKATMLLIGDILQDRNGNDYITMLIFNRMLEQGASPIILMSNHDGEFLKWFLDGMPEDTVIDGDSSLTMRLLVKMGLVSQKKIQGMLDNSYFKNVVMFYYETDKNGKIGNIATHAPIGEHEIWRMMKGMAAYAKNPAYAHLFTDEQKRILARLDRIEYDDDTGLEDKDLKEIMDVINDVVHVNAMKEDKKDLAKLIAMGTDRDKDAENPITGKEYDGQSEFPFEKAPLHGAMWNRISPRKAAPNGTPRTFRNGHDDADRKRGAKYGGHWRHNNVTYNNRVGQLPRLMEGENFNFARPGKGLNPMNKKKLTKAERIAEQKATLRKDRKNMSDQLNALSDKLDKLAEINPERHAKLIKDYNVIIDHFNGNNMKAINAAEDEKTLHVIDKIYQMMNEMLGIVDSAVDSELNLTKQKRPVAGRSGVREASPPSRSPSPPPKQAGESSRTGAARNPQAEPRSPSPPPAPRYSPEATRCGMAPPPKNVVANNPLEDMGILKDVVIKAILVPQKEGTAYANAFKEMEDFGKYSPRAEADVQKVTEFVRLIGECLKHAKSGEGLDPSMNRGDKVSNQLNKIKAKYPMMSRENLINAQVVIPKYHKLD